MVVRASQVIEVLKSVAEIGEKRYHSEIRRSVALVLYGMGVCKRTKILASLDELERALREKGYSELADRVRELAQRIEREDIDCEDMMKRVVIRGNRVCYDPLGCFEA